MPIPESLAVEFEQTQLFIQLANKWTKLEQTSFTGHVITAWNPRSKKASPEDNAKANDELLNLLIEMKKICTPCKGTNYDESWIEQGFAIEGLSDDDAKEIGLKFNQWAVFRIVKGQKSIIDCSLM